MPDYVEQMLAAVNCYLGYGKYKVRLSTANNGKWCIDIYDNEGYIRINPERIGSKSEIAMFITGMYQMIPKE